MPAYLHGLSTALPPNCLAQSDVKERATALFADRYPQFDRLAGAFETAGVDRRHSVVPLDWFSHEHGWKERNEAYLEGGRALFVEAATSALRDAGWTAAEVDCVVTVSSTGIATPTLEAQVFNEMGFRDHIMRVPVFGLGCAGGVSGLSIARTLADGTPGTKVLLVVVETCTVAFRADRLQKADIIAAVLFGDGAAGACLSSEPPAHGQRVELGRGHQRMWPDTLGIMGWDVDDIGFGVVFDRSIPSFVHAEFAEATGRALSAAGLNHGQIDRYVCHPGGAKVLEAIESALDLGSESLDAERDVLRAAGNMSAPTVLFVMKAALENGASGQMMACALGPGFTASYLPLRAEPRAA
ncbi:type III polyketide synthase [Maritimibacter sp. DP07]|uniref:Type III polyketide synthase n=1 Tax=Maritimibacter harenae TaxID=2606218 RepID=A0A845M5R3_9RHOB|nr:type III polyketide synthase [Maritimibacter harenae]MZR11491.1 type III polyketide synthase [Maritimibacter harenae]